MKTVSTRTKRGRPRKYAHDLLPDVTGCDKCPDPLSGECTGRCKHFTPIRFLVEKPKKGRNKT